MRLPGKSLYDFPRFVGLKTYKVGKGAVSLISPKFGVCYVLTNQINHTEYSKTIHRWYN